jgi:hypothetical protein
MGALITALLALMIFGRYLPGPAGYGHDFALFFPAVLAEHYAAVAEGIWATPWFTPAFCGGIPVFADPQWAYFSLMSVLIRLAELGPAEALKISFFTFAALGFLGTFLFATTRLSTSIPSACFAAFVFALNGFFVYRFLIGHLGFHGITLIPMMALLATGARKTSPFEWRQDSLPIIGMGIIATYWIYSGAVSILIAFVLSTAALILLFWLRGGDVRTTVIRSIGGIALTLGLSASKLTAAISFLSNAPRTGYSLPGFEHVAQTVKTLVSMLFLNLPDISTIVSGQLVNAQWLLDRQELEYGVTIVPGALAFIALMTSLARRKPEQSSDREFSAFDSRFDAISYKSIFITIALIVVLIIPIALNTFSPAWNDFLKSLPILGSTSSYVRWFLIYIPFTAICSALWIDQIANRSRSRTMWSSIAVLLVTIQILSTDKSFYANQNYDPKPILTALQESRTNPDWKPRIKTVDAYVDERGNIALPGNRNDLITDGVSQLACYAPQFGYRLEFFPVKTLTFGDVLSERDGLLNIKNPACYVFPKENNCSPGDHFRSDQRDLAENFVTYKQFSFEKSNLQVVAELITFISAISALIILAFLFAYTALDRSKRRAASELNKS